MLGLEEGKEGLETDAGSRQSREGSGLPVLVFTFPFSGVAHSGWILARWTKN